MPAKPEGFLCQLLEKCLNITIFSATFSGPVRRGVVLFEFLIDVIQSRFLDKGDQL